MRASEFLNIDCMDKDKDLENKAKGNKGRGLSKNKIKKYFLNLLTMTDIFLNIAVDK